MRALVTGSARGIGSAMAAALVAGGADVVRCDVDPGGENECLLDVSDADAVRDFVARTGPFDVLVNNAGVVRRTGPTNSWDDSVAAFDDVVGTNLRGAFLVGRAVMPAMVARGSGHIVNVATDHVHTCGWPEPVDHADAPDCPFASAPRPPGGGPSMDVYDASKWGVVGLTLSWAAALAAQGVRVNCLCVGATDTPMLRSFLAAEPDPAMVAGWVRPEACAAVAVDLVNEGPSGRTGDCIGIWPGHPAVLPAPGRFSRVGDGD